MRISTLSRIIVVLCLLPLASVTAMILLAFHVRAMADRFLSTLDQIQVGISHREDAERLLRPLDGYRTAGTRIIAGHTYPADLFVFRNHGLRFPGFITPAHITGTIAFRNGIVIDKEFVFTEDAPPFSVASTWEVAHDLFPDRLPGIATVGPATPSSASGFASGLASNPASGGLGAGVTSGSHSGLHVQAIRPAAVLSVRVDPQASAQSRRAAYGFNLACFTSFHGCGLAPQILPNAQAASPTQAASPN